ncbi:unnamed protein product [Sphagnum jensenii]|uniref:Uncharacterized protein n=1 Tax=Sphagnum jensenii TaxID=128206 RepID=A0ABP1B2P5_9BRYO
MSGSVRARKELLVPPNMGDMDAAALTVATGECTFLLGKPKSSDGSCCCRDKLLHTILHKLPDPFPMAVKPYTFSKLHSQGRQQQELPSRRRSPAAPARGRRHVPSPRRSCNPQASWGKSS